MEQANTYKAATTPQKVHPKEFTLWLSLVSMAMIFAAFTSAYIVRKGDGNWLNFELPSFFNYSTICIAISSLSMIWAHRSARTNELKNLNLALGLTTLLGLVFLVLQFMAYGQMVDAGLFLVGNPSTSFIYIISGVHGVHIFAGLIALIATFAAALQYKVHSKAMLSIRMTSIFWHFLGILWIYLYLFLKYNTL